jgi:hypothetical protein
LKSFTGASETTKARSGKRTITTALASDRPWGAAELVLIALAPLNEYVGKYHPTDADERGVLPLFGRVYNDVLAGIELMFSGYVQPAYMMQRDIFECLCLCELFVHDRSSIGRWAAVRPLESTPKKFRQVKIREKLDSVDSKDGVGERDRVYQDLSYHAAHPNYRANAMLDVNGRGTAVFGPLCQEVWIAPYLDGLVVLLSRVTRTMRELFPSPAEELVAYSDKAATAFNKANAEYGAEFSKDKGAET